MTAKNERQLILTGNELTDESRRRIDPANAGLRVLNPEALDHESIQGRMVTKRPRMRYASMKAHQEMAAQALAVGTTQRMAAKYAGVSPRQIKKYWADPDFRTRVEELRTLLASRIRGKIYRELNRRVTGKSIQNLEIIDLTRILDRLGPQGGKGMTINVEGDLNANKYDNILASLFAGSEQVGDSDATDDGEDFPQYGNRSLTISGKSTPVEG